MTPDKRIPTLTLHFPYMFNIHSIIFLSYLPYKGKDWLISIYLTVCEVEKDDTQRNESLQLFFIHSDIFIDTF